MVQCIQIDVVQCGVVLLGGGSTDALLRDHSYQTGVNVGVGPSISLKRYHCSPITLTFLLISSGV